MRLRALLLMDRDYRAWTRFMLRFLRLRRFVTRVAVSVSVDFEALELAGFAGETFFSAILDASPSGGFLAPSNSSQKERRVPCVTGWRVLSVTVKFQRANRVLMILSKTSFGTWTAPWNGRVGLSLAGHEEAPLESLVARTVAVAERLAVLT